ncbi:MAG: copper resistance protein NlpE [Chitinophagales bacterium]
MKWSFYQMFMMAFLVFSACNHSSQQENSEKKDSSQATIAATPDTSKKEKQYTETYYGTLPCADCSGIQTSLALTHKEFYAEGTFQFSQKYLGRKENEQTEFSKSGDWTTDRGDDKDPDATVVELFNVNDSTSLYFLRVGNDLKMLDQNMREIKSKLNYTLKLMKADSAITAASK